MGPLWLYYIYALLGIKLQAYELWSPLQIRSETIAHTLWSCALSITLLLLVDVHTFSLFAVWMKGEKLTLPVTNQDVDVV